MERIFFPTCLFYSPINALRVLCLKPRSSYLLPPFHNSTHMPKPIPVPMVRTSTTHFNTSANHPYSAELAPPVHIYKFQHSSGEGQFHLPAPNPVSRVISLNSPLPLAGWELSSTMEQEKPSRDLILPGPTLDPPPKHRSKQPKKKRGPMHFIKVALFMIRSSGSDKSKAFSASKSKSLWTKLVGSVRPLHLQLQQEAEPEAKRPLPPALTHRSPARTEFSEDSMFSPSAGSSRSVTATPYASAVGLNEMAQSEDETEAVGGGDSDAEGDHMIDAKAEEFIANFYNEMRLQRRHSINERSLR